MAFTRTIVTSVAAIAAVLAAQPADAADAPSKPPEEIVAAAAKAFGATTSVHMEGFLGTSSAHVDLTADVGAAGMSVRAKAGAVDVTTRALKSATYIKANRAFWRALKLSGANLRRATGNWVKTKGDPGYKSLSPRKLAPCITKNLGTLTTSMTTLDGRDVIAISDAGDKPGSARGRIYVAADGSSQLLRVVQTGRMRPGGQVDGTCNTGDPDDDVPGALTFSAFDKPVDLTAPRHAITLPKLTKTPTTV